MGKRNVNIGLPARGALERPLRQPGERTGAALVLAISLLALFSMLGTLYVRHMSIEMDRTDYGLRQARAQAAAQGGLQAALGNLRRAYDAGQAGQILGKPREYGFTTYDGFWNGEEVALAANEDREAGSAVAIGDESGKLNINHAPAPVLQAVLGIDADTAKKIVRRVQGHGKAGPKWLLSVDGLRSRGLVTEEQFAQIDRALLTTYSVVDHAHPVRYLNANQAPLAVLAAVTGLEGEALDRVAKGRPYRTIDAFLAAVGLAPDALPVEPAALRFDSRCFRIVSRGHYKKTAGERVLDETTSRAETVLLFDDSSDFSVLFWSGRKPVDEAPAAQS